MDGQIYGRTDQQLYWLNDRQTYTLVEMQLTYLEMIIFQHFLQFLQKHYGPRSGPTDWRTDIPSNRDAIAVSSKVYNEPISCRYLDSGHLVKRKQWDKVTKILEKLSYLCRWNARSCNQAGNNVPGHQQFPSQSTYLWLQVIKTKRFLSVTYNIED